VVVVERPLLRREDAAVAVVAVAEEEEEAEEVTVAGAVLQQVGEVQIQERVFQQSTWRLEDQRCTSPYVLGQVQSLDLYERRSPRHVLGWNQGLSSKSLPSRQGQSSEKLQPSFEQNPLGPIVP